MKFVEQAPIFFERIQTRKRHPVKPATLSAYRNAINSWILPSIGQQDLETFSNGALKAFIHKLTVLRKSPATIQQIVTVVKSIVASAVTPEGDLLYPRIWNNAFLDLPDIGPQKAPTLTQEQLRAALRSEHGVFYAFLAGTGLRIGEALAVRWGDDGTHTCLDPENAVVRVRTKLWYKQEGTPKTDAGIREVDLDPRLNALLSCATTTVAGEPIFNKDGKFLCEGTMRAHLKSLGICGFHTFRRYRITRLRELGTPEDIVRYWAGHAGGGITDRYSKLAENKELRKQWAVRAGLGFELPEIKKEKKDE
jgi:integrase